MSDFDSLVDDSAAPTSGVVPPSTVGTPQHAGMSFDDLQDDTAKYEGTGEQLKAGAEGLSKGLIGATATNFLEKNVGHTLAEDIRGRAKAHPITQGVGQAVGLGTGLLTGTGEAAVMTKAGELAAEASGLERAAGAVGEFGPQVPSFASKVGSSAVKQAAEMAVLQSDDEVGKMIINDPEASAQSAIANIGLATALGGAGGAFITGAVSPLWSATVGPKLEATLGGIRSYLDGGARLMLPEEVAAATKTLGIEVDPVMRAGMSGEPKAAQAFNELREVQHPEVIAGIEKLHKDANESVMKSLNIDPEEIKIHSEVEAGHAQRDTFLKEFQEKYAPRAAEMEERNTAAAGIPVSDKSLLNQYGQIVEKGMNRFGTDSPLYKVYNEWGDRLLNKSTIGAIDSLKTEISGALDGAIRTGDTNMINALKDIRMSMSEFQESQIASQARGLEKQGVDGAKKIGADTLNRRADINRNYSEFAGMSDELLDNLGLGHFKGAGGLKSKLEKLTAEDVLKKFSPKGNADFIPFLEKNFPETLEHVRQNELKKLIKPAVLGAKGENAINLKTLDNIIAKGMAGQKEYMDFVLPKGARESVEAAKKLTDAIPDFKSSGTAGWQQKLMKHVPQSAMSAVAMLTGHNPAMGFIAGHLGQLMARDLPDGIKLGLLKFLASEEPVKAEGFKAMVEFMHNTARGESMINKAATAIFKPGAQVLTDKMMPAKDDREKLDKLVTKFTETPDKLANMQGHTGHYMPTHQMSLTQSAATQVQYLASLKPKPVQSGPLDKPHAPLPSQIARYNRALDIATNPAVVLHHVKEGTLQTSDIQDLHSMSPALYNRMVTKVSNQMNSTHSDENLIPYRTRMGLSLFLGQPVDSSMLPSNIIAAQPKPKMGNPMPNQGNGKISAKASTSLNKGTKAYMTPNQGAEADRQNRD